MKQYSLYACLLALLCVFIMYSCKKDVASQNKPSTSSELARKVAALGFDTTNIVPYGKGYLVENDIYISAKDLNAGLHNGTEIRVAQNEQYRTFNLVTGFPRTIRVRCDGLPANCVAGTDEALSRWNNIRLDLSFTRVSAGAADIVIRMIFDNTTGSVAFTGDGTTDASGYPSGGNPSSLVNLNTRYDYSTFSQALIATIIQHELGHTLGLRHTDYMNSQYSCGDRGGPESDPENTGAVHIPGSPSGPDPNSFMLACGPSGSRSFNPNDVLALSYLYNQTRVPKAQPIYEFYHPSRRDRVVTVNANHQLIYGGWNYIGFSFRAFLTQQSGAVGIYEYYNDAVGDHTYSPVPNDPNILSFPNWDMSPGIVFYVYPTNVAGSIPVYRYYNVSESSTLFTSNSRIHLDLPGWTLEGISFYALPS